VHAGEAFLILPGEVVTYAADREDPWSYQWIGFDGELAKSFAALPTVFPLSATFTQKMLETEGRDQREYRIAAALFEMYAALFGEQKTECDYVRRVKDHIRAVYMQELRVEEIARSMNLDRRYLSRYFKEKTGQTVQEYLISVRMEEAQKMLLQGRSVAEAALLSGYQDPFHFSKMFKRRFGISPLAWRAKQL
jgi:AraC-like DNA-binding protein